MVKIDSLGICVMGFYVGEAIRSIMMTCFVFWSMIFCWTGFDANTVEQIGESERFSVH